jgi:hypothetical protein
MSDFDPRFISGERGVYTTTKHWAALIVDSLWAIGLLIGSFVLAWVQPDSTSGVLGFFSRVIEVIRLGLFFAGCGWIVYNVVAWRTAEYTVTNLRVFGREGLVRRRSTDTLLSSLADIRTVIPALGGLLGYGNIRIISASGDSGMDSFTAVRDATGFKRQVLEQKAAQPVAARAAGAAASTGGTAGLPPSTGWHDASQLLGQLANLRDAGVLTPQEYEAKKAALLSKT